MEKTESNVPLLDLQHFYISFVSLKFNLNFNIDLIFFPLPAQNFGRLWENTKSEQQHSTKTFPQTVSDRRVFYLPLRCRGLYLSEAGNWMFWSRAESLQISNQSSAGWAGFGPVIRIVPALPPYPALVSASVSYTIVCLSCCCSCHGDHSKHLCSKREGRSGAMA